MEGTKEICVFLLYFADIKLYLTENLERFALFFMIFISHFPSRCAVVAQHFYPGENAPLKSSFAELCSGDKSHPRILEF